MSGRALISTWSSLGYCNKYFMLLNFPNLQLVDIGTFSNCYAPSHCTCQVFSCGSGAELLKRLPHSEAKPPDLLCCSVCTMQCVCAGGFCSVLLVWNLLGGPHESGYIYLLPQSSLLVQCSTATTCTIQTWLCSGWQLIYAWNFFKV